MMLNVVTLQVGSLCWLGIESFIDTNFFQLAAFKSSLPDTWTCWYIPHDNRLDAGDHMIVRSVLCVCGLSEDDLTGRAA